MKSCTMASLLTLPCSSKSSIDTPPTEEAWIPVPGTVMAAKLGYKSGGSPGSSELARDSEKEFKNVLCNSLIYF